MAMTLNPRASATHALHAASHKDAGDSSVLSGAEKAPTQLVRVPTTRFGSIEVEESLILTLPEGLIGFDQCHRFVVVRHDDASAFRWLQSLDSPAVALPILEPSEFCPDYAPILANADVRSLGLGPETPRLMFVIITVPPQDPRSMTANLLGPIVINGDTRLGRQVIVQNDGYTTRHLVVEELQRAQNMRHSHAKSNDPQVI